MNKRPGRKPKLTTSQVDGIRWYYAQTSMSMEAIAERFGVSAATVARVINRQPPYTE